MLKQEAGRAPWLLAYEQKAVILRGATCSLLGTPASRAGASLACLSNELAADGDPDNGVSFCTSSSRRVAPPRIVAHHVTISNVASSRMDRFASRCRTTHRRTAPHRINRFASRCRTTHRRITPHHTMPRHTTPHRTPPCHATPHHATPHRTILYTHSLLQQLPADAICSH